MAFGSLMNQSIVDSDFEYAIIRVTGPSHGTTVTMTLSGGGTQNLTEISSGVWEGKVSSKGTYTVSAGSLYTTSSVVVDVPKTYNVSLRIAVSGTLNDNSWSTISNISSQGKASQYWSVGQAKEIILDGKALDFSISKFKCCAFIIGINHNASLEGNNKIHFQIANISLSDSRHIAFFDSRYYPRTGYSVAGAGYFVANTTETNSGGWVRSYLRNTVCNSFKSLLPTELLNNITSVGKYSNNVGNNTSDSAITKTYDFIFLLSQLEIDGVLTRSNQNEKKYTLQYSYYSSGNSKVFYRYQLDSFDGSVECWMRSVDPNTSNSFLTSSGNPRKTTEITGLTKSASRSYGIAPCFCV